MPPAADIGSVDSDGSSDVAPLSFPTDRQRSRAKPSKKAPPKPPKRPKSLLQHRADLEKKEQRRRKLKSKLKFKSKSKSKKQRLTDRSEDCSATSSDSERPLAEAGGRASRQLPEQQDVDPEDDDEVSSASDHSSQSSFHIARQSTKFRHDMKATKSTAQEGKKQETMSSNAGQTPQTTTSTTEVLFPAHILAEEVQHYMDRRRKDGEEALTDAEAEVLDNWVSKVHEELEQQNQYVVENIGLVADLRKVNRRRNQLQDQLLQHKKKTQALQQEAALYQSEVDEAKKEHSVVESAQDFLRALKRLARQK